MEREMNHRPLGVIRAAVGPIMLSLLLGACTSASPEGASPTTSASTGTGSALPGNYASAGTLRIGVRCDYPPEGFLDTNGEHAGSGVDLAKALATAAFGSPDKAQLTCITASNRIPFLTTNKIDVIIGGLGWSPERAEVVDYTQPYKRSTGRLLVQKDTDITAPSDLRGKSVILASGTPYVDWFKDCEPDVERIEYDSVVSAFDALKQGRAPAYAEADTSLVPIINGNPEFKMVGVTYSNFTGIGVRKGDEQLRAWIDGVLDEIIAKNGVVEIMNMYADTPDALALVAEQAVTPDTKSEFAYPESGILYTCP